MKLVKGNIALVLLLVIATLITLRAGAQNYPTKPIRLIVPFAPGGTTDIVARLTAERLGKALDQPVIVDNRAGGGGVVGAMELMRSSPDGYTLGLATVSTTATNPAINPKIPYDPIADFTPIINIAATPGLIAIHPRFPARDYKGFIAELRKNPGKYSYASSGTGGVGHLQTELFKSLTGVFMTHIPYRGAGPALNDVVSGQVLIMFDNLPSTLPFVKGGRLIPIAVAASKRLDALPDVPTFKELGLEAVNRMTYFGLYGPKNLPLDVVNRINAAVKQSVAEPSTKKRIEDTGSLIVANDPEQFAQQIRDELKVYKKIVETAKLKLD